MNGEEPRPGLAPGSRSPVGTMFAALYGDLVPHQWRHPEAAPDAYFLFYERSLAMGWLDDVGALVRTASSGMHERQVGARGLWGMNDAGQDHPLGADKTSLVAWFQVGVEPVSGDRPLPVQPFLRCAGEAAAHIGALRVDAVQVLLPVQGVDATARPEFPLMPSLLTVGWFGGGATDSRTSVQVTLDSGQAPSIPAAAPAMRDWMTRLEQDVFVCESYSTADRIGPIEAPFDDTFWNGPSHHRATFHGTLAEWSLDAIGWLGGFLADLSARNGVTTPVLLTATRP